MTVTRGTDSSVLWLAPPSERMYSKAPTVAMVATSMTTPIAAAVRAMMCVV